MKSFKQFSFDDVTEQILENLVCEGNPLARLHKNTEAGRHYSIISAQRSGLSAEENAKRHKELKAKINAQGYSHREVEGHWEGDKEKSIMVHAKSTGNKAGEELRHDMNVHGRHYDQDSVFHHNSKTGHIRGTNKSGYPGYGKKDAKIGKQTFNRPSSPAQTETKPKGTNLKHGRTDKSSAKFTTS